MLKAFGLLSKEGKKKIIKAGMLLALFQIICTLPMLLIVNVMASMIDSYRQGLTGISGLIVYLIIGIILIAGMYICYRVMYKAKYLNAADENMNLRMSVADKFRRLPESYLSRHDLSDLTSAVMDDIGTLEGVLTNQVAEMIGGVTGTLIILTAMYFVNVKMALILTIVVPLAFLSMSLSDLVSGKTHMRNRMAKLGISDG
ncbi:MAG: ABC transporter ATP-binding protein, partial [Saccharofermentans sp.]|nr:ABC transporter ATP-binding protein [Saccharofermentans sp.]